MMGDGVRAEAAFWRVSPPVFSPDSSRLGFFGFRRKGHGVAMVDDLPGPEFADVWGNLVFSDDSRHTAYLGQNRSGGFLSRSSR